LAVATGVAFTVTLPVISAEAQPLAFLTVKVKGILEPEAAALKLTVIEPLGNVPSVTVVMPVPEIE
jgi:hypothetical protein